MKKPVHLVALLVVSGVFAGCEPDNSNSSAVKANPEAANRYKQPAGVGGTPPKGAAPVEGSAPR